MLHQIMLFPSEFEALRSGRVTCYVTAEQFEVGDTIFFHEYHNGTKTGNLLVRCVSDVNGQHIALASGFSILSLRNLPDWISMTESDEYVQDEIIRSISAQALFEALVSDEVWRV